MGRETELVLANRAYVDHDVPPGAPGADLLPAGGGLLAALRPVVAPYTGGTGTTWISVSRGAYDSAWSDADGIELIATEAGRLRQRRLDVDAATWAGHYAETSNGFLWPALHLVREELTTGTDYFPRPRTPSPAAWERYRRVNEAFAAAALRERAKTAWVHDYQLGLVPGLLRDGRFGGRVGFFLHTTVPSAAVVLGVLDTAGRERLGEWLAGVLSADLVGVQTHADADRLRELAAVLLGARTAPHGLETGGRLAGVGVFPVGIDAEAIEQAVAGAPAPPAVAELRASGLPLVAGLERLDVTKGIPERLAAVAAAFEGGERFAYLGVIAPGRPGVGGYERLEASLSASLARAERAAATAGGRVVVSREALRWPEVLGLLREARVVFTSSLADGMNLVPLQAAIAQAGHPSHERATIITGRDTGTAAVFGHDAYEGILVVDPLDPDAMVATLRKALRSDAGRAGEALIEAIRRRNAAAWAARFRETLERGSC